MKIMRGDILLADLGVSESGSIQSGIRPVVVVSNNRANRHSLVFTVVPLTTRISKKQYLPTHVFMSAYRCSGLERHSLALCEQVGQLDYANIIENMGRADRATMARITKGVQVQIGVYEDYNG